MGEQYIDVFYEETAAELPYHVFVFEHGVVTAQCEFGNLFPVALFCQAQQMPVLSEFDEVRSQLRSYDIDAQPLKEMVLG
jgi:hypothetical protein